MRDRAAVLQVVQDVLSRFAGSGVEPTAITEQATILKDLRISSVRIIDLVLELEDSFGISVDDEAIEGLRTVGDIADYVAARLER